MQTSTVQETNTSTFAIIPELLLLHKSSLGNLIHSCTAIITSLILALIQDMQKQDTTRADRESLGWRNRYNIHLLSGVSQKEIYKDDGVLAKLIKAGLIEKRPSQSRWGNQRHHYRLNFSSLLHDDKTISN